MAKNITASGSTTIVGSANAILVQVNAALTGTIVCQAGGNTFATITNPTVGSQFRYGGLTGQGTITVNPSTSCDISVTVINGELS